MKRKNLVVALALTLFGTSLGLPGVRREPLLGQRAVARKQVWLAPGPGSPDFLALFTSETQWTTARERVAVFQFYEGHLLTPPPQNFEGNTYTAFRNARAFQKLTLAWGKAISIEVGAVKEHYCSTDGTAEAAAVSDTLAAIRAIETAGGVVSNLAMDEPFYAAATIRRCGAPDAESAADRVAAYIRGVKAVYPRVKIGLVEPYPYFPASSIARWLSVLRSRGTPVPFLHVDAGVDQMKPGRDDFARDMRYLAGTCAADGTRFGIIFNGDSGESNGAFMAGAWRRVHMTEDAFGDWPDMPQDLVFQSWAQEAKTGRYLVPTNLPETTTDTETNFLNLATPILHGPQHYPAPRRP